MHNICNEFLNIFCGTKYLPIKDIHDYIWFNITDFKGYPVNCDDLRDFLKLYFRSVYL